MPTGINNRRHHDVEKRVEPRDGLLGGIRLGERGEVADVDEHHRHLAALTCEHVVTLLEQAPRQGWVDIGAERGLKTWPLGQSGMHSVEGRCQLPKVIVLVDWQALAVISGLYSFGSCG